MSWDVWQAGVEGGALARHRKHRWGACRAAGAVHVFPAIIVVKVTYYRGVKSVSV